MVFSSTAPAVTDGGQRLPRVCCTQNVINPLRFYCLCHDATLDTWLVRSRLASDCLNTCLCVFALHRRNECRLKEALV